MEKNVGGIDRNARIVIGVLVAVAGIAALGDVWEVGLAIGGIALLVGVILLVTGTTQKCPINDVAGIDTTED
jgi:hypothetical protein